MKKRIEHIEAFESAIDMGNLTLEPIPTFHPPSLQRRPAEKATKLMKRLMDQDRKSLEQFRFRYLLNQPRVVPLAGITVTAIDPTPIMNLYFNSMRKK